MGCCHPATSAALETLHAAFVLHPHCRVFGNLQRKGWSIVEVMKALQGDVVGQLLAGTCLVQVCEAEVTAGVAKSSSSWCQAACRLELVGIVFDCIQSALKVSNQPCTCTRQECH